MMKGAEVTGRPEAVCVYTDIHFPVFDLNSSSSQVYDQGSKWSERDVSSAKIGCRETMSRVGAHL